MPHSGSLGRQLTAFMLCMPVNITWLYRRTDEVHPAVRRRSDGLELAAGAGRSARVKVSK